MLLPSVKWRERMVRYSFTSHDVQSNAMTNNLKFYCLLVSRDLYDLVGDKR